MAAVVLIVHLFICAGLIALVLLQRSEGGALGMGGGGGGSLMTGRSAADALAKMTSFAGGLFLVTSLSLTVISGASDAGAERSVLDRFQPSTEAPAPAAAPAPVPAEPVRPDPTESSIETETQLAAAPATAPAPVTARDRAGPLASQPASATTPRPTPAAPATTNTASRQGATTTPAAASGSQAATVRTEPVSRPAAPPEPLPAALPATNSVGIELPAAQLAPESGEADGVVQTVRRERAGPDQ